MNTLGASAPPRSIESLLGAILEPGIDFPRAALVELSTRRDEAAPLLLRHLRHVANVATRFDDDPSLETTGLDVALFFLAAWGETRALPPLLEILRLPTDDVEEWLGDLVTEDLLRILAQLSPNDSAPIVALAEDREVDEFVRGAAVASLRILFVRGHYARAELSALLVRILAAAQENEESIVPELVAMEAVVVGALEALAPLRAAFDDGRLDEWAVGNWDLFEADLRAAAERPDESVAGDRLAPRIVDPVAELEPWWPSSSEIEPPLGEVDDAAGERDVLVGDGAGRWAAGGPMGREEGGGGGGDADRGRGGDWAGDWGGGGDDDWDDPAVPIVREEPKVGRNDPCPCGSGKKYKKCCGG